MIAIGGTIGACLFAGSGQTLAISESGLLFLAYSLTSIVYGVIAAIVVTSDGSVFT